MTDTKHEAQGLEVVAWQDAENQLYTTGEKRQMHGWATDGYPIVELVRLSDATAVIDQLRERVAELEYAAELDRTADLYAAPRPVAQDGWIPISERLPPWGYCLAFRPAAASDNKIATTQYNPHVNRFSGQYPATHWMPLPAPPEVKP